MINTECICGKTHKTENAYIKCYAAHADRVDWAYISVYQHLSEAFIHAHADRVDWGRISMYQHLSEAFIHAHADRVNWDNISVYQHLSEAFIHAHSDRVNWYWVSKYQHLSEAFITDHADRVNWDNISQDQKLSEKFIHAHSDRVNWDWISQYQHLSEAFIHAHADRVNWDRISIYQHLSEEFIHAHTNKIKISPSNMSYWTEEGRNKYIDDFCKKYNLENHKDYIIAYKSIRHNHYSKFNFTIKYTKGCEIVDKNCDCNINEENSFGLSAWNKEKALEYFPEGKLIKVKIFKKDVGCVLINTGKIRCFKQTVL